MSSGQHGNNTDTHGIEQIRMMMTFGRLFCDFIVL